MDTEKGLLTEVLRNIFSARYCHGMDQKWLECRRLITHSQLHFCPDFVTPDSEMTLDEIMDRFDEEMNS